MMSDSKNEKIHSAISKRIDIAMDLAVFCGLMSKFEDVIDSDSAWFPDCIDLKPELQYRYADMISDQVRSFNLYVNQFAESDKINNDDYKYSFIKSLLIDYCLPFSSLLSEAKNHADKDTEFYKFCDGVSGEINKLYACFCSAYGFVYKNSETESVH